jgi:hypothetical protein
MADHDTSRTGRPSRLLEEAVRERLLAAVAAGMTHHAAAVYAGIHEATFYRWMARGRAAQDAHEAGELDDAEEPFREFCEAVTRAHAHGQHANVMRIDRVAEGGHVVRRRTRRYRDPATGQLLEEIEEDVAPPDWRAAAWVLERRHPDGFARPSQLQVSGPGGGPVEVAQTPGLAALAERVAESLAEYRAEMEALDDEQDPPPYAVTPS